MENPDHLIWCDEIDEFLTTCETIAKSPEGHEKAIVRHLRRLMDEAPEGVKVCFGTLPAESDYDLILEYGGLEKLLFEMTLNVGLMISRAPSGQVLATIGIPGRDIEYSAKNHSLPLALAVAIAASALEVQKSGQDPLR